MYSGPIRQRSRIRIGKSADLSIEFGCKRIKGKVGHSRIYRCKNRYTNTIAWRFDIGLRPFVPSAPRLRPNFGKMSAALLTIVSSAIRSRGFDQFSGNE